MILFSNPYKYAASHKLGTAPGETLIFDTYATTPGIYQLTLDASIQAADDITLNILIKPSPSAQHRLYLSLPIPAGNKTLWKIDIPACSGVILKFAQRSGLEKQFRLHVWKRRVG